MKHECFKLLIKPYKRQVVNHISFRAFIHVFRLGCGSSHIHTPFHSTLLSRSRRDPRGRATGSIFLQRASTFYILVLQVHVGILLYIMTHIDYILAFSRFKVLRDLLLRSRTFKMKETLGSARGRLTKTIAIHPTDERPTKGHVRSLSARHLRGRNALSRRAGAGSLTRWLRSSSNAAGC